MKNVADKQKQKINKDTRGKQTNKQTKKRTLVRVRVELTTLALSAPCSAD